MTLQNHSNLFERGITGTLANTIHGHLYLTCTIQYTLQSVGCGHTEVVVTVGRNSCILNTIHMIHQILDLGTILIRQTVACSIRNIDYSSTSLDNSLNHTSQILIIRTSGILCIELHILYVFLGILHGSHSTLDDFFAVGIELIFDMTVTGTNASMDSFVLGILKRLGRTVNILLHRTCQRTDGGPCNRLGNLHHRIEVARA